MIDDMRYPARWRDRVWPYEATLTAEETEVASTGTFLEMIRHGTTCFCDPGTLEPEAVAKAAENTGIRGIVARMTWDVHDPAAPSEFNDDTATALARGEECVQRCSGLAEGRVNAWFSLVRADHVSDSLIRDIKRRADALGVGIHAHSVDYTRASRSGVAAVGKDAGCPLSRPWRASGQIHISCIWARSPMTM